jgi:hypothetical protein
MRVTALQIESFNKEKKMAWEQVQTGKRFVKYSEAKKGEILAEGKYIGADENEYGVSYSIETDDGILALPSCKALTNVFDKRFGEGTFVQVIYNGRYLEGKHPKGKEPHLFVVNVDKERSAKAEDQW